MKITLVLLFFIICSTLVMGQHDDRYVLKVTHRPDTINSFRELMDSIWLDNNDSLTVSFWELKKKDIIPTARLNIKDGTTGENIPLKFGSGTLTYPIDSGTIEYLPDVHKIPDSIEYNTDQDTGNNVIYLHNTIDWQPSLDMWDSLAILNKYSEFQIIDSMEGSIFHYYVSEHDTSLFVRDSLATIKWLINSVIENNNQINQAYDILKYVNTDGEIIDKKRFKQAVKKFNQ